MVAAGSNILGPIHSDNSQTAVHKIPLIPMWKPRGGRGPAHVLWEDGLHDVLPKLGMRRDDLHAPPPERPSGHTLCAESLHWYERAMDQYHREGTELFDAVRPSLDLDGPYAAQDIRLIQKWKDEYGRKDGRALVRWALSFVDQSSVSGQIALVKQMGQMALPGTASLYDLSEHLMNLWECWLALATSDRDAPASFFRHLMLTLPVHPEGPLVKMRSWLVDLIEDGVSPLLRDIDGERGLLARLVKYADSHGLKDVQPSTLTALNPGGAPPGGGDKTRGDKDKRQCNECRAFACKRQDGKCICKHNSTFDLSTIGSESKRQYVELMRAYNKKFPNKSLANVTVKVVREALDKKPDEKTGTGDSGKMAYLASVSSVLGDEVSDVSELDAWLKANDSDPSGMYAMSDAGEGVLKFEVVEDDTLSMNVATGSSLLAMASALPNDLPMEGSGSSSGTSSGVSGQSTRTAAEVTATEIELAQLQQRLAAQEAAFHEANARVLMLESRVADAAAAPGPAFASAGAPPTPSTARAATQQQQLPPWSINMTPRDAYSRIIAALSRRGSSGGQVVIRQPRFTPATRPIAEEARDDDAVERRGGSGTTRLSSTEHIVRGLLEAEREKRVIKGKVAKAFGHGIVAKVLTEIAYRTWGVSYVVVRMVVEYVSDNVSTHSIVTLGLLAMQMRPVLEPLIKKVMIKLTVAVYSLSLTSVKSAVLKVRAVLSVQVNSIVNMLLGLAIKRVTAQAAQATSAPAPGALGSARATAQHGDTPAVARVATHAPDASEPDPTSSGDAGPGGGSTLMALDCLGNTVVLASMELRASDNLVPALMDDGASNGTSCCRTLDGAIPGTCRMSDAGEIGLGSDGATLESKGSYLYALRRVGVNAEETVLRRCKHTPKLPMAIVFSEATENRKHGYGIHWDPGEPRVLKTPSGLIIEMFMSKSDLGWLKVQPITDAAEVRKLLALHAAGNAQLMVKTTDPTAVRSVGMGKLPALRGAALLRRQHIVSGHASLPIVVKNLRAAGAFSSGLVTVKDVELFAQQGCGTCETTKMRRRPFTIKIAPRDNAVPQPGKLLVFDLLELRTPAEHTGNKYVYIAVDKASKFALAGGVADYSEVSITGALNEIRARTRPTHGEIEVFRMDSHATHKSKGVRDFMLGAQQRLQLSPGYVHEGVGDAEVYFLHAVPSANAALAAAPDLGENHFTQALRYVVEARNYSVTANSNPPKSPAMIYFGLDKFESSGLLVFGAAAQALVHGEARATKFDLHAQPCVYVGPAINSDSRAHCAVWHKKEYKDVDLGCVNVQEDTVIELTRRGHPATQPYNQVGGAKTVDIGMPTSIFDLTGMEYTDANLPEIKPIVWVRGMRVPQENRVLLLWHGELRKGDMASWVWELGANKVVPIPIDVKIGGQEHNLLRGPIKKEVLELFKDERTKGGFVQPECGKFSAARYKQPGPPVLFDLDNPDGIFDEDGELPIEATMALNDVRFLAELFRATKDTDKVLILEHPASQATGSPYAAPGHERHSTVSDTSIMCAVRDELGLEMVYTEQGACGAKTRKPTTLLGTKNSVLALRRVVGALYLAPGAVGDGATVGTDDNGDYVTQGQEVYTSQFAMRLAIALLGAMPTVLDDISTVRRHDALQVATDDIFPAGTIVELYWYGDQKWYRGVVLDSRVRKGMVHGLSIDRREIKVCYDADNATLWHAIADYSVRRVTDSDNDADLAVLAMLDDRIDVMRGVDDDGARDWLNMLDHKKRKMYCSNCGSRVTTICWEAHCMRGPCCQPNESCARCHTPVPDERVDALREHVGEVFVARQLLFDMETYEAVDPEVLFVVTDEAKAVALDTSNAHKWHTPQSWREYLLSPQKDLWRSAMELKMDDYHKVRSFELVPKSSVDTKVHTIHRTLWVFKIKFKDGGLIFDKLNPRWCVVGTWMDRNKFKSYAEMMRATSFDIMLGLKTKLWDELLEMLIDFKDAFQATGTVDADGKLKEGETEFYTEQPPGFVKKGPNGEEMVARGRCYMQGRIDATRGFDNCITNILIKSVHFEPMLWDSKVFLYNNTDLVGTTASFHEIVKAAVADTTVVRPQQPPRGVALAAMHVDDMAALMTGSKKIEDNRILSFMRGEIADVYASKVSPWHGQKALGRDISLNDEQRTVTVTAQAAVDIVRQKLFSKANLNINPRHIVTEAVYDKHPGVVPEVNDPQRASYLEQQAMTRSVMGAGIWMQFTYPQITAGINAMCQDMANPGDARLGQLRHMFMYLGEKPPGKTFGGPHVTSVCGSDDDVIAPFTKGKKEGRYHFFSDASMNVTGGVGMFAGCCIQPIMLRQHLQAPDAHASELVGAGTNIHQILPVNGLLQELGLRRGYPTTVYFDSISTVFVASSDAAPKKSVWLQRRAKVVTETVEHGEIKPVHIDEIDMVADSFTKYIKHDKWVRHMHYVLNLPGDPPDCHELDWVKVTKKAAKGKKA